MEIMTELWLDDERDPDDPFIQEEFGAKPGMFWAKTAWSAISRLKNNDISFISLDHDLGSETAFGTGYVVAKWIEKQAFLASTNKEEIYLSPLEWAVHSMNVEGAKKMRAALNNATRFWNK